MCIESGSVLELIDSYSDLFREHYDEVAPAGPNVLSDVVPDRASYAALENAGLLFTLLVRDDDDRVVGYSVNITHRHMHYRETVAQNDTIFLRKAHRGSGLGQQLIRATEDEARRRGAVAITIGAKPGADIGNVLPKFGYTVSGIVFKKEL